MLNTGMFNFSYIYIPTFTYVNVMGIYGSYKVHLRLIPVVRA